MVTSPSKSSAHFRVSPAVLGPLGAEQLQDPALAVLELIKNSWDAGATRVSVVVDQREVPAQIRVSDDGRGMTMGEFHEHWLVIGRSHKRGTGASGGSRPLIGEKGLGRLASFALGDAITVESAPGDGEGFRAEVDWSELSAAPSLEEYAVDIVPRLSEKGTIVTIRNLKREWLATHTEFLVSHTQFLVSVPGQEFRVELQVNAKRFPIENASNTIERLAEASLSMRVEADGRPLVTSCTVKGADETDIVFRDMKASERRASLAGATLSLRFFRRDQVATQLSDVLERNEVTEALERYQGVRIFRDGINIPSYGLNGNDWAGLEKQRTATGGPTLVPGNSQLVGELHILRESHPQLVITAGRSGFADQSAVGELASYVRWAVKALGTARRAEHLGISDRGTAVPARVDDRKGTKGPSKRPTPRAVLADLSKAAVANPELKARVDEAAEVVRQALTEDAQTLRLYAQLASTGIAATSFSHELRTEFDVVSEALDEISSTDRRPDRELLALLTAAWERIRAFAGLFKVIPVKTRRRPKVLREPDLTASATAILALAPRDQVTSHLSIPNLKVRLVPAELDAILLNLISNGLKAISESPQRESGQLRLELRGARGRIWPYSLPTMVVASQTRCERSCSNRLKAGSQKGLAWGYPSSGTSLNNTAAL